jgi:uncharacterized protein (DUF2384 family)
MQGLKKEILDIESPDIRLNAVFGMAVRAFDDVGLAHAFALEQHRGHTGMALGAGDMETFVDVTEMVRSVEGTRRVVEYLQGKMVKQRLVDLYKSADDAEAFMTRKHMMIGMKPVDAIKNLDDGYELLMKVIDAAEAGVCI